MKNLLLLGLLMPFLVFAQQEHAVIGCKILLEKGDYIADKGNIFIKHEVQNEIFDSVKAWQMLEFKVFIYVQCPDCGAAHLVDHACNSDMCKNKLH